MSELRKLKLISELRYLPTAFTLEDEIIPKLGINRNMIDLMPERFAGYAGGLQLQQYPCQLAHFWRWLSMSNFNILSYLEIGVWTGGMFASTTTWLDRFNNPVMATAVDIELVSDQMKEYLSINPRAGYYRFDTRSPEFAKWISDKKFDLVLIDGDHTEQAVRNDYNLVKERARIIAFHDLYNTGCPGVEIVFREAVKEWPKAAIFCQQYPEIVAKGQSHAGFGVVYG
jgi:hypothetical protein